jgi:ornithine carbamoyltransferase
MALIDLYGRDLITTQEWSREELDHTLALARDLKKAYYAGNLPELLKAKTFFMLFYNTSTRTRASFEAAATALGGHAQFIDFATTRGAEGEAVKDIARMYERYGHGLGVRILESAVNYEYGRGNAVLREYAANARIPVINMADDVYHPCQGLTDIMTIQEKLPHYEGKKYVLLWTYSDRIRSWGSVQEEMLIATRFGIDVTLCYPEGFDLDEQLVTTARGNSQDNAAHLEISHDPKEALRGAHIVFPRSWASHACTVQGMNRFGKDNEVVLHNKHRGWTLTREWVELMAPHALVTHVLPVFRGQEATDEVMDGPHSVVIDQAENRLHTQMAIMALTMGRGV